MSIGCVYTLITAGKLAHVRIGVGRGTIRIPEGALEEFLARTLRGPYDAGVRRPCPDGTGFSHLDVSRLREAWREQGVGLPALPLPAGD